MFVTGYQKAAGLSRDFSGKRLQYAHQHMLQYIHQHIPGFSIHQHIQGAAYINIYRGVSIYQHIQGDSAHISTYAGVQRTERKFYGRGKVAGCVLTFFTPSVILYEKGKE